MEKRELSEVVNLRTWSNQQRRMDKYQEEIKANDLCNKRWREERSSD